MGGKQDRRTQGHDHGSATREPACAASVNATLIPIGDGLEGVAMLEAGLVDAFAGDKIKLVGLAAQGRTR